MLEKIDKCIHNDVPECIFPFFWQHGENREELKEEIDAIFNSGITQFCVESRTHNNFGKEEWWEDFGFILEYASAKNMSVWLLDDKNFPTGYCNGAVKEKNLNRRKLIREEHIDVAGEVKDAAILANRLKKGEKYLCIVAYKRVSNDEILESEYFYLTDNIYEDILYIDVPEGNWRIFFIIETDGEIIGNDPTFYSERFKYYIDMLDADSCKEMINAIYNPHYERYKKYFGNTFKGFFSDEPCFANELCTYESKLGRKGVYLPYSEECICTLSNRMNVSQKEILMRLPHLWFDIRGQAHSHIRYNYMDFVTIKYKENFADMLGNWCREHNVMYVGHIVEDMHANMRLGYSAGHYFRSLWGQDMAGIDVVLHQIVPGMEEISHLSKTCDGGMADPEFYNYTLAKLCSSLAHIDPKKQGRAMCEIFGAYGWAEGLPMMKYLADHMLVSGINNFVPHAFTPKFPDYDCPPHFYAKGKNPQHKNFKYLTQYMKRMSYILSSGTHKADVIVLYNAEGEWTGGRYSYYSKIAKYLTQNQIDFDFVPADIFINDEFYVSGDKIVINNESYRALIVSYSEIFPEKLYHKFEEISGIWNNIYFTEKLPSYFENGEEVPSTIKTLMLEDMISFFREKYRLKPMLEKPFPYLRYYCLQSGNDIVYMFFNEDMNKKFNSKLNLGLQGAYILYQPWNNAAYKDVTTDGLVSLTLDCGETAVIVFPERSTKNCNMRISYTLAGSLDLKYDIYLKPSEQIQYQLYKKDTMAFNINGKNEKPNFGGYIMYWAQFNTEEPFDYIEFDYIGEAGHLYINDIDCGCCISRPYRYFVGDAVKKGKNKLVMEVTTNLGYSIKDIQSKYLLLKPAGIMGNVNTYKQKL